MPTFGENLRALRRSRGYSQEKFAQLINSNQACITAWECGTRTPHLKVIQGIADTFKVPVSTLLPLTDTGMDADADRELLDFIHSNPKIEKLVNQVRYLSNDELDTVLNMTYILVKAKA